MRQAIIQTYTGRAIDILNPSPADIHIEDIAWALSNMCRFNGHVSSFYSVAQHSVLVSRHCEPRDALWGELHDASEAYIADIARPFKHTEVMKGYREVEARLMRVICDRFGLPHEQPESVTRADHLLLASEAVALKRPLLPMWDRWFLPGVQLIPICPMQPATACSAFLARFEEL